MKSIALITASILGLTFGASAAPAAKTEKVPAKSSKGTTEAKADAPAPMHTKVDSIDAAGKSITHTTEKGTKVTNKVTAATVIMQGDKTAQFSDIKVGDYVSGTHLRKSNTEFEIVKITKFGPEAPKTPKAAKPAPTKKP